MRNRIPAHAPSSPVPFRQQTLLAHFSSSSSSINNKKRKSENKRTNNSDSEDMHVRATRSFRNGKRTKSRLYESDDSIDVENIKLEPSDSTHTHSINDSDLNVQPTRAQHGKRRQVVDSDADETSDSEINVSDRERAVTISATSSKTRVRKIQDYGSDLEEAKGASSKRRLIKRAQSISDDDDDIMDGIDEEKIVDSRLRGQSSKKMEFLKQLQKLKKRKDGRKAADSELSSRESSDDTPIPGAQPHQLDSDESQLEDEDDADESQDVKDFIVEDDDGDTAPVQLPAAFSMHTYQDLAHHFKVICQYLVHLIVVSSSRRKKVSDQLLVDEYFSVPLNMARRKLGDICDSVASSVWRPSFIKALQTFPDFELTTLDFTIPQCDACHLGGRLSKFVGRLNGTPYDHQTFEDLNHKKTKTLRRTLQREFHFGRFCAQRTGVFHDLYHWELKLIQELAEQVNVLQTNHNSHALSRMFSSEATKIPSDLSDPDQIMEFLDQRGIIASEWLKVKQLMAKAAGLEARGEDD